MTDEQVQGKVDQAKGEVKEDVGAATGDSSTENAGKWDQFKGKVEEEIGDLKEKLHHDHDPKP